MDQNRVRIKKKRGGRFVREKRSPRRMKEDAGNKIEKLKRRRIRKCIL